MAVLITIIMLSFAGIPPLGFFAKYYMFYAVIEQGHIWLVVLAIISSLIGVYYYLRPVITMYTSSKENQLEFSQSNMFFLEMVVLILLFIGFAPQLLTDLL